MTRYETVRRAATEGSEVAHELFRTDLAVDTKQSTLDLVTKADTETQRRTISVIRESFPDATIVGEEEDERKSVPEDGDAWVIDPIDGTTNFVHGSQLWTTTVASVRDHQTVAAATVAPALGDIYAATPDGTTRNDNPITVSSKTDLDEFVVAPILRYGPDRDAEFGDLLKRLIVRFGDLRRLGCAQVTLAMVACGTLDVAASEQPDPNPWDTIAGVSLVRRAGGTVTDIRGNQWVPGCEGLVASNGEAHDEVLDRVTTD
ncbi:inositol monophosphatase family protein [Haloferax denitrificans]|uniref:inositol monophosphatase family protein n=1 Tax=Haloferax denitrificans TaxID=35745 RepID=UPI0006783018